MSSQRSGQILLLTLLTLTVVVTIGLSLIGRSRIDTTISTDIEESTEAFNAAEAGIEDALKNLVSRRTPVQLSEVSASYTTNVSSIESSIGFYSFPQIIQKGESEILWLINHKSDQTRDETPFYRGNKIKICWKGINQNIPALLITILYKREDKYYIAKTAFDPDFTRENNFFPSGRLGNGCGQTNVYSRDILFSSFSPPINVSPPNPDILISLTVLPVYADANIFFDTEGLALPSQGNIISSTGKTGSGVERQIIVFQYFRSPLSIFESAIISQTSFSK